MSPLGLTVRFWSSDTLGEVLYVSIIFTFLEITFNSFLVLCFFFFYSRCSQWHILILTILTPVYVPSLIFLSKLKTCAIFPASCGHAIGSRAKWLQQPFSTPSAASLVCHTLLFHERCWHFYLSSPANYLSFVRSSLATIYMHLFLYNSNSSSFHCNIDFFFFQCSPGEGELCSDSSFAAVLIISNFFLDPLLFSFSVLSCPPGSVGIVIDFFFHLCCKNQCFCEMKDTVVSRNV